MSELLTLDDERFNGGKRDLGKFIDNAVISLSLKIRVIQYVLLNFVKLICEMRKHEPAANWESCIGKMFSLLTETANKICVAKTGQELFV